MQSSSPIHILQESLKHICQHCSQELKTIFKDQGILIFLLVVPLVYPLIYAFIYTSEVVREVPVAVVDESRSSQSRKFLRLTDGSPDLHIQCYCTNMEEAKEVVRQQQAYGIIYIPKDFSHNLAKGEQAQISIFCDMSGMLYYKAILTANTEASLQMNRLIKIQRAGNYTCRQDEISTAPIRYEGISLFNPQNGFASFLIPAVLILIIQQTLLLGVGVSAGTAREKGQLYRTEPVIRRYPGVFYAVAGKSSAYLLIYSVVAAYVLCLIPHWFSLVQLAHSDTLPAFTIPYLLACIFFAITCSVFVQQRESCMMIYVFTSVPLLFISGISWPGAAVPEFWRYFSYLFPSTFGINGFVRINSMGATLAEVSTEYRALWLQSGIYFLTACLSYGYQTTICPAGKSEKRGTDSQDSPAVKSPDKNEKTRKKL